MSSELQLETAGVSVEVTELAGLEGVTVELVTEGLVEAGAGNEENLEVAASVTELPPVPDLAAYMDETTFTSEIVGSRLVLLAPQNDHPTPASRNVIHLSSHARTAHLAELSASREAA